jgi:restriction system protein
MRNPDPDNVVRVQVFRIASVIAPMIAPWAAGLIMVFWLVAEFQKGADRRRLDKQTGIDSIRGLTWQDFERLLAEAFRRRGYFVEHCGGAGADGGVDVRLTKGSATTLVQCKHWKAYKVGVRVVRELYGVMQKSGSQAGVVVTSGTFTAQAADFARDIPVTLMDGTELADMIQEVQRGTKSMPSTSMPSAVSPVCPTCGSAMLLRTARKGAHAGLQFWGCSAYPKCRGVRTINMEKA